ncbi:MAG: response regulator [Alphaproteobacteria bacterium]
MAIDQNHSILVVDDDSRLRELLRKYLSEQGYTVEAAEDASAANDLLLFHQYDLMILDIMMPGQSGNAFASALRADASHPARDLPILMLTAMGETEHRIEGLENGADDYLAKPFEPRELLLRIQTILKRCKPAPTKSIVKLGDYSFDTSRETLLKADQAIPMTTVETNLLKSLAENPGKVISREDLAHLSGVALSPRTIDVQVTRLRRKIEPNPKQPIYIRTVRHQGYVLRPDQ